MDKQVVLAVAGAGKTSSLIKRVQYSDRVVFITFTNANEKNITDRVIEKFGEIPKGFRIYSYFTFLYRFCYLPFLADELDVNGIRWNPPPEHTHRLKRSNPRFFISSDNRLYSNRIAKLVCEKVINEIRLRLEKYFDLMLVDEVQDFAGHDFDLLMQLAKTNIKITCAGDYFQHTYDTSRDGNINASLHKSYVGFQRKLAQGGFEIDCCSLQKSYRCSPTVCSFIAENLGISISSHRDDHTTVEIVSSEQRAEKLMADRAVVKLFFSEHHKHGCYSRNWGDTKGEDCFSDVCVVLTKKASQLLADNKLSRLPPSSLNKLYVAASRAKGNLYMVPYELMKPRVCPSTSSVFHPV